MSVSAFIYSLKSAINYQSAKIQTSKFQFDLETVDEEPPRGNATANSLLLLVLLLLCAYFMLLALPSWPVYSAGCNGNNSMCHCLSKFERKRSADLSIRPEIKYPYIGHFTALLVQPIVFLIYQATGHIHKNKHNSYCR